MEQKDKQALIKEVEKELKKRFIKKLKKDVPKNKSWN